MRRTTRPSGPTWTESGPSTEHSRSHALRFRKSTHRADGPAERASRMSQRDGVEAARRTRRPSALTAPELRATTSLATAPDRRVEDSYLARRERHRRALAWV